MLLPTAWGMALDRVYTRAVDCNNMMSSIGRKVAKYQDPLKQAPAYLLRYSQCKNTECNLTQAQGEEFQSMYNPALQNDRWMEQVMLRWWSHSKISHNILGLKQ